MIYLSNTEVELNSGMVLAVEYMADHGSIELTQAKWRGLSVLGHLTQDEIFEIKEWVKENE